MDLKEHHFEGAAGFYGEVDLLVWFGPSSSWAPRSISVRRACDWRPPCARMPTSLRAGSFGEPALRFFFLCYLSALCTALDLAPFR
jgi:hypothetical protein